LNGVICQKELFKPITEFEEVSIQVDHHLKYQQRNGSLPDE
jgi:hypothetical protein